MANDQLLQIECNCLKVNKIKNKGAIIANAILAGEIETKGIIHAKSIECKTLDMHRGINAITWNKRVTYYSSARQDIFNQPSKNGMSIIGTIKAEDVYLENIICDTVYAKHVIEGENCHIGKMIRL